MYQGLIHKYPQDLPIDPQFIVSLNEGQTPLLKCQRLTEALSLDCEIYLKFEGLNPTGSFKDRGMTYAVSKAKEARKKSIICASTGNTSASASAYAARAGMKCVVLIPEGKIALGKLSQALIHGAEVVQIRGNFDDALSLVEEIARNYPIDIVNSVNPYRLLGQMTASFEVIEALGQSPDYHFLPVGNAGNISAYWMGYQKAFAQHKVRSLPKMMGYQAEGASPLVLGHDVDNPETLATAIRIGKPRSGHLAIKARDESQGVIDSVTDQEILKAYQMLATYEGYFAEPASAAGVAGLIKWARQKKFTKGDKVVCTLTGHGLKDPNMVLSSMAFQPQVCDVNMMQIIKHIGF